MGIMLIDQSAAFDLCDHALLVQKLKLLGVEENAACWMERYLSKRSRSTLVDGFLLAALPLPPCSVISRSGRSQGLLYKHLRNLLIQSWFVKISFWRRHALMVVDGASSHKINYVSKF